MSTNPNLRKFYFIINNKQYLKGYFNIDTSKYQRVSEIRELLKLKLNIEDSQFMIKNYGLEKKLIRIADNSVFHIKIINPAKNIIFQYPNTRPLTIVDSSTMTKKEILSKYFEGRIYFSDQFISDNINFIIWGFKIPNNDFDLSFIPRGQSVLIKPSDSYFKLNYDHIHFHISVGEKFSTAIDLVKTAFSLTGKYVIRIISRGLSHQNPIFIKGGKYKISISYLFDLIPIKGEKRMTKNLEYKSTVSDLKKFLVTYYCDNKELNYSNIQIFDENKQIVPEDKKLNKMKAIYFDIQYDHLSPKNNIHLENDKKKLSPVSPRSNKVDVSNNTSPPSPRRNKKEKQEKKVKKF